MVHVKEITTDIPGTNIETEPTTTADYSKAPTTSNFSSNE